MLNVECFAGLMERCSSHHLFWSPASRARFRQERTPPEESDARLSTLADIDTLPPDAKFLINNETIANEHPSKEASFDLNRPDGKKKLKKRK